MNENRESVEKEAIDDVIASATGEPVDGVVELSDQPMQGKVVDGEITEGEIETPEEAIARLESELFEARAKADMYLDQMQRAAAEFQNTRRRQDRQLQESIDRATEGLIRRLLPVLDDFELAFNNVPPALQGEEMAWNEGFQRIHQKLAALMADEGIKPIALDGEFDPNRHEAVTHEPSDSVESGHIIATLRIGYTYGERVLRPALVRVAQ
ncbi:nucleotide exchange factor GrpE [bacterium]|nr:nucleotide exchange factor GrpE [bacterium]